MEFVQQSTRCGGETHSMFTQGQAPVIITGSTSSQQRPAESANSGVSARNDGTRWDPTTGKHALLSSWLYVHSSEGMFPAPGALAVQIVLLREGTDTSQGKGQMCVRPQASARRLSCGMCLSATCVGVGSYAQPQQYRSLYGSG